MRKLIIAKGGALAIGAGAYATRRLDLMQLIDLAADQDKSYFNNWFALNDVPHRALAAMWITESSGNPRATKFTGGDGAQGGAWGLGQVTALTATDYGVIMPLAPIMLLPLIGSRVSMKHVQFNIRGLKNAGFSGSPEQWVQSYNVGLAGFIRGDRNEPHLQRFLNTFLQPIF